MQVAKKGDIIRITKEKAKEQGIEEREHKIVARRGEYSIVYTEEKGHGWGQSVWLKAGEYTIKNSKIERTREKVKKRNGN